MGRIREPFTLTLRKRKRGAPIFYYRTYDQFGRRTNWKSTGFTKKREAKNYCLQLFKENRLVSQKPLTLSRFIKQKHFFVFGKCEYCLDNAVGKTYADDSYSRMKNHVIPILGSLLLDELTVKHIEEWQRYLVNEKKLAVKTVRQCRTVLKIILDSARSDGFLSTDIMSAVKRLPKHEKSVRGILTEHEVRLLFDRSNINTFWKGNEVYYTASLLACFTGMRQGEIRAITADKIFDKHIYVSASYGKNGIGPTKTKETRNVFVRQDVLELIKGLSEDCTGYVFSLSGGEIPISGNRLTDALYDALDSMGISQKEREERNLTFHSFRHWLVTYLRASGLTDAQITSITGQKTSSVIDGYTRYNEMDNRMLIEAIERF